MDADWRISTQTAGLQRWQFSHRVWHSPALFVVPHLHCSFSHVEEVVVVCVLCAVPGDHLKVHPRACVCNIARHMPFVLLVDKGLWMHSVLKRFHPGAFRTAEQESKLSCPFSCRYWKPQILDLWVLQKRRLISVASSGFHFYWELIAQPWSVGMRDGIKNVINIRAQLFCVEG